MLRSLMNSDSPSLTIVLQNLTIAREISTAGTIDADFGALLDERPFLDKRPGIARKPGPLNEREFSSI